MGKALVIKNVSFSGNKIETVTFSDKGCTDVEVTPSTISFNAIGATETLTVVLTPSDTTDEVSYASSNENVATVANGVVTCVGIGTATITVTCGSASATCTVTANNMEYNDLDWNVGLPSEYSTDGLLMGIIDSSTGVVIFAGSDIAVSSTKGEVWTDGLTVSAMRIPSGADTVKVTMESFIGNSMRLQWFNSKSKPYASFPNSIAYIGASSFAEIKAVGNTFTVPDGADSFLVFVITNDSRAKKTDTSDVASAANIQIFAEKSE